MSEPRVICKVCGNEANKCISSEEIVSWRCLKSCPNNESTLSKPEMFIYL